MKMYEVTCVTRIRLGSCPVPMSILYRKKINSVLKRCEQIIKTNEFSMNWIFFS